MRFLKFVFASGLFVMLAAASAPQVKASDSDYMTRALSAAPAAVAKDAAVVRFEKNGSMTTLRAGTNGFTCMIVGVANMCADANGMAFFGALMHHTAPPNKVGVAYMLTGDAGASNTDPYSKAKTATNHWIVTGPHIMVLGPPAKALGLSEAKDPDPNKPYMMWAGTPYEHAMIPIGPPK